MPGKRKLTSLSLKEKKDLIALFEKSNVSKTAFAKEHNIPRTTLSDILSSKQTIEEADCKDNRKRMRKSKFDEIEEILVRWLKHARSQNVPISSVILKEKAMEIAKELNIEDFHCSNGWLERFKDRNCLSFKTICGEAAAVDGDAIENWRNSVLKDILSRFDASNVFNLDETGLFYRLLPDKTLSFKGEKCTTGKASKQRLTLLLGANMNGNEKLKPLVIGKSKRPRCFKNVKSLPVEYEANSNAWMTTMIWERHIRKLDSQFSRQKRKVALIVDNCTAHSQPESLKAIEIVFLPPNVTALLQPLDQGIIRDFKRKYKKMLVKDLIKALDKNEKFEVSVLDAINYVHRSWSSVSTQTVFNCFRHAGFVANAESEDILCEEVDPEPLENLLQVVNEKGCSVNDVNAFVDIDNDIAICSQATVKDLTSEFLDKKKHSSSEDSDNENSCGIPPSKTETLEALEKVRRYLTSIESTTEEEFKALMILEKKVNSNQQFLHQSTMLSYFNAQK
nr:tigger transposable element-derived protein 4-like [Parasteatoda tepidariorum]